MNEKKVVKKNFEENIAVYEALRNEIVATQGTRANLILYMYTTYVAIYALGVQFSKSLFLITLLILLSFQSKINRQKYIIVQISTYIKIFFEEDRRDIHWESSKILVPERRKSYSLLISRLSLYAPILLGLLSWLTYIFYTIKECIDPNNKVSKLIDLLVSIPVIDLFWIIFSFMCIVILWYFIIIYRDDYDSQIEKGFRRYKRELKKVEGDLSKLPYKHSQRAQCKRKIKRKDAR